MDEKADAILNRIQGRNVMHCGTKPIKDLLWSTIGGIRHMTRKEYVF